MALSPRQTETLEWIAAGKSTTDIGTILGISKETTKKYLGDCRRILNATSSAHCCSKALLTGQIKGRYIRLEEK